MIQLGWQWLCLLAASTLCLAAGASAAENMPPAETSRWSGVKITVIADSADVTLRDPAGRTAAVDDGAQSSEIPGCRAALNPRSEYEGNGGYIELPGGHFDLASPAPGTWTLTVRLKHDRRPTPKPTVGAFVAVLRDSMVTVEKVDRVRLLRAGDWVRWKLVVGRPGFAPDSAAVRLVRDHVWARDGDHLLQLP